MSHAKSKANGFGAFKWNDMSSMPEFPDIPSDLDYLVQASCSFSHAHFCAKILLKDAETREESEDDRESSHSNLLLRAIEDSCIIYYSRPFKTSNGIKKLEPESQILGYSEEEKALHKNIIERRDKIIAHSDKSHQILKITKIEINHECITEGTLQFPQIAFDFSPSLKGVQLQSFHDLVLKALSYTQAELRIKCFDKGTYNSQRGVNAG